MSLTQSLVEFATSLLSSAGLPGLFALATLEILIPPIPSGAITALAGFLAGRGLLHPIVSLFVCTAGNAVGGLVQYWLGLRFARPALLRWGKYLTVSEKDLARAEEFFRRRGVLAVVASCFVPGIRSLMGFPAGVARMSPLVFAAAVFVGNLPWNAAFIYAGYALGEHWDLVLHYSSLLDLVGALALSLALAYLLFRLVKRSSAHA